ncbi:MAG: hypothetical protein AAF298_19025 [Cyanobacteria bacterium P01_A01_bin.40]
MNTVRKVGQAQEQEEVNILNDQGILITPEILNIAFLELVRYTAINNQLLTINMRSGIL